MDGEGDAAALEHADKEAESDVEEGEDVAMGHQQQHHHRMRAQSHPPPTRRGGTSTPNPNKKYNNWNMCYSCGYDIPIWYTSATCDNRKHGHQVGCTRANVEQYTTGGHYVSTQGAHKVNLPVNPGIHQE